MIRVLISAQIRLFREALAEVLAREQDIEVVGVVAGRNETLEAIEGLGPDVVVLDVDHVPGGETIRELARSTDAGIVGVLALEDEQDVIAHAEAGLCGFVTHEDSYDDLIETIHSAARGDFHCSPKTAGSLLRHIAAVAAERSNGAPASRLTAREREVVHLLEQGLSNKQIAARLHIQLATVKHHVHHILEKLEVSRRSEAVARARRAGLLPTSV